MERYSVLAGLYIGKTPQFILSNRDPSTPRATQSQPSGLSWKSRENQPPPSGWGAQFRVRISPEAKRWENSSLELLGFSRIRRVFSVKQILQGELAEGIEFMGCILPDCPVSVYREDTLRPPHLTRASRALPISNPSRKRGVGYSGQKQREQTGTVR